jgi:GTP-binding protein Era
MSVRSGFVALIGRPNAGKSTLLNRLVGERLAITSPKPQTTRTRVMGIRTTDDAQMVFVDTPGLLNAEYALHERMRANALAALNDADVLLHIVDPTAGSVEKLETLVPSASGRPHLLVLTKADLLNAQRGTDLTAAHTNAVLVSAVTGVGVDALLERTIQMLPEGPALYPAADLATQPVRFFVQEFVREAALEQLDDEVPYALACVVEEFREERAPLYIRATVYVERDSQKRILIGAGGVRVRELGRAARSKIEAFLQTPVYLDLWIKVQPRWRREPHILDRLGYTLP